MILKKIKLENIRSYVFQELEFSLGSTLLAGDIGAGKSTVLLAIDFALFGIRRTGLSGGSLLRKGTSQGSVELSFSIDGKEVVIKRSLSKTKDSVKQDAGFIIVDGVKENLTAVELKDRILKLLNYPKELLTKSKSLVYRYTVYTPQEQMKQILVGDSELRVDTLRKVFGVDKYKRIKENSKVFLVALKGKRKEIEGFISDLDVKKQEKVRLESEIKELEVGLEALNPSLETIKEKIMIKDKELGNVEERIKEIQVFRSDLEIKKNNVLMKQEQVKRNNELILNLRKEEVVVQIENPEVLLENIQKGEKLLGEKLKALEDVSQKIQNLKAKKLNIEEIVRKIRTLDRCPTCKQTVSSLYKNQVIKDGEKEIGEIDGFLVRFEREKIGFSKKVDELRLKLEELKGKKAEYDVYKMRLDDVEKRKGDILRVEKENSGLSLEINKLREEIIGLENKINSFSVADVSGLKQELDVLRGEERELEVRKAGLVGEIGSKREVFKVLSEEVLVKEKKKERLSYFVKLQAWLEESFVGLMGVMERNIMLRAHADFNSLFEKWTNVLLGEENISMKLGYDFSPLIEQNGHDIDYGFLSGGEKTAGALAYRLALNQVINNLMVDIKTKDLIILDEPTDGFSREQLDRMRMVLDELKIKQVILVSHEEQIESFVDKVVRVSKEGHVSRINTKV